MVQLWNLPQRTSLGTAFGQATGHGIAKGAEQGIQRGLSQNALAALDKIPANASPLEKTKYLLQATAGLPDQGRILQALSPMLIGQGRNENIFGMGQGQNPQTPQNVEPPKMGGHLPQIPTEEQVNQFATNYAIQHQNPAAYAEGRAIAEAQQAGAKTAQNEFRNRAIQEIPELKAHPERIPLFLKEAEEVAATGEKDINKILSKSREQFRLGTNRDLDSLINGYVPGAFKGALKKSMGGLGITSAFAQGGRTRDEAVHSLSGAVKRLINKGYEAEARGILSQEHKLSPTEIEELIHPLNEKTIHAITDIPDANKIPQASHAQRLDSLLEKNFSPNESLLAIRHRLWNEKSYDWREVAEAMKKLEPRMSEFQKLEMNTIENSPPIQSLSDIFQGWYRLGAYLSGAK